MNAFQWGAIQSAFTIGGLLGALGSGAVATNYGRLTAMKWLALFLAGGPIAESLAGKAWVMGLGRGISGIGAGAATVACPIYVSEVSPQKHRGLFGAFTQVQINFGIVIAQLLGYFLSTSDKWRWILSTGGYIAGIMFFAVHLVPETPKWLARNNRPRMARGVLQRLRGKTADIRDEMETWDVSGEGEEESLLGPSQTTQSQIPTNKSIIDVIRTRKYRRQLIAVAGTMMAQQLCGINSVVMYSVAILGPIMPKQAGLITVIISAVNVVVTLLAAPLPDKIGRKTCLLLSIAGMGLASSMLYAGLDQDIRPLAGVGIALFVASFGVGLGPVPFILLSELVSPEAVGAVSSWALACNWLSTFLVSMFFPALNDAMGNKVWWLFSGIAAFWAAFVGSYVPESKGMATADEVWSKASQS